ncbi:MAG: hypothetical protein IJZ08_02725, partial [Clostridia bacterium]|nr:hypothetical protein [Clostridia bacterium]
MKNSRKTKTGLLAMALLISLIAAAVTVSAYDGTSDPLISLSYLEQYKATSIDPQITALNAKVTELEAKLNQLLSEQGPSETLTPPDTGVDPQGPASAEDVFTVLQLS